MNYQQTSFDVAGMSCGSCVNHIQRALRDLHGVQRVDVQLSARQVRVEHDPAAVTIEQLVQGFADAGYEATARSPG